MRFIIVDDEPDIIEITELVLDDFTYREMPVVFESAHSGEEAKKILAPTGAVGYHVGLIDVIMETEHSGIELCEFIRHELRNSNIELYVRTGQAGLLKEEDVMLATNINGFYEKENISDNKLRCLAIQGSGSALTKTLQQLHTHYMNAIAAAASSALGKDDILGAFQQAWVEWDSFLELTNFASPITSGFMHFINEGVVFSGGFGADSGNLTISDTEEIHSYPLIEKINDKIEVRQQGMVVACISPAIAFAIGFPRGITPWEVTQWGAFLQVMHSLFVSVK